MKFIHHTVSLCKHCYRHVPAVVFEHEEKIWLSKLCPEHGEQRAIVDPDAEFYYGINYVKLRNINSIMIEVTDRCQLNCPHCYQLPDNKIVEKPLELLLSQVDSFPKGIDVMMAGAEATMYKDFIPLAHELAGRYGRAKLLTNAVRFSDEDFVRELYSKPLTILTSIGLNHVSYQGEKIHNKQLKGIENIKQYSSINDIGYTLESYDQLPDIFEEISKLSDDRAKHFRIRGGSFIGRSGDPQRNHLSTLIKEVRKVVGDELISTPYDDNTNYNTFSWRGNELRLVQWCDVETLDLEETHAGPWAKFTNGPVTHFLHQIITRDAFVNMKLPMLDEVPEHYKVKQHRDFSLPENKFWRDGWEGPVEISEKDLEYKWIDEKRTPKPIRQQIEIKDVSKY